MSNPIDCRFITSRTRKSNTEEEEAVYLRKEDVVRLLRELANNTSSGGDVAADDLFALADTLERIER